MAYLLVNSVVKNLILLFGRLVDVLQFCSMGDVLGTFLLEERLSFLVF